MVTNKSSSQMKTNTNIKKKKKKELVKDYIIILELKDKPHGNYNKSSLHCTKVAFSNTVCILSEW